MEQDRRPAFVIEDVKGVDFQHVKAQKAEGVPTFVLKNVEGFGVHGSAPVADTHLASVKQKEL